MIPSQQHNTLLEQGRPGQAVGVERHRQHMQRLTQGHLGPQAGGHLLAQGHPNGRLPQGTMAPVA